MSSFKPDQRHLTIRGRHFHFVSYEARAANERSGEPAVPPTWHLMLEGRRCLVFPCDPDLSKEDLDLALAKWVAENVPPPTETAAAPARTVVRRPGLWRELE